MYVCKHLCMYVCMHVCIYLGIYACMYACMYVSTMYVCVYVCMYICMYVLISNCAYVAAMSTHYKRMHCFPHHITTWKERECVEKRESTNKERGMGKGIFLPTLPLFFLRKLLHIL